MGSNVPCEASCVTVKTSFAGVNYADVCVRWGLYESARKYVRERVRCVCGVYAVCVWCGAVWCGVRAVWCTWVALMAQQWQWQ